jgi:hypothetical protein
LFKPSISGSWSQSFWSSGFNAHAIPAIPIIASEIASAAFVVDAKDDSAAGFYAKYDFLRLNADGRRMFLPMATIARLFS